MKFESGAFAFLVGLFFTLQSATLGANGGVYWKMAELGERAAVLETNVDLMATGVEDLQDEVSYLLTLHIEGVPDAP